MYQAFTRLLNMSLSAGILVLVILLLRLIFKKAPKRILCFLWVLVAVRLLVPFSISSNLSVYNLLPHTHKTDEKVLQFTYTGHSEKPAVEFKVPALVNDQMSPDSMTVGVDTSDFYLPPVVIIWLLGVVVILTNAIISYRKLKKEVAASVRRKDNIYICDDIQSPFILGIIRPAIYLPSGLSRNVEEHVIRHEMAHLSRMDHLWKPLGYFLLSIYWFHPFIWIAYILLCRDIEAACDEKVIKEMDREQKAGYSEALLTCAMQRRQISVCPLAFGENNVKGRVKAVLNYRKPSFWIAGAALIACMVVGISFLTDPVETQVTATDDTTAVSIIGGADGPTSIFLAGKLGSTDDHDDAHAESDMEETSVDTFAEDVTIEPDQFEKIWADYEKAGLVKTENGITVVSVTTVEDYAGNESDEEWSARVGDRAVSVHINGDKSVTYEMTKEQYAEFLHDQTAGIRSTFYSFIDQEQYSIKNITFTDDYLEFRVELKDKVTNNSQIKAEYVGYLFAAYGRSLRAISGADPNENIVINFYDPDGNVIRTINSTDLNSEVNTSNQDAYYMTIGADNVYKIDIDLRGQLCHLVDKSETEPLNKGDILELEVLRNQPDLKGFYITAYDKEGTIIFTGGIPDAGSNAGVTEFIIDDWSVAKEAASQDRYDVVKDEFSVEMDGSITIAEKTYYPTGKSHGDAICGNDIKYVEFELPDSRRITAWSPTYEDTIDVLIDGDWKEYCTYHTMTGKILEISEGFMLVEPIENSWELASSDRFMIPIEHMNASSEPEVGDVLEISYDGSIEEVYPARLCNIEQIEVYKHEAYSAFQDISTDSEIGLGVSISIDGTTYFGPGIAMSVEPDESVIEYVVIPVFGDAKITAFARIDEGKVIACLIDGEWYKFHTMEVLASSVIDLEE